MLVEFKLSGRRNHKGGNIHSARTRGFSLMKAGKVSAFKSWTSDAEATAAAPMSPKAMFLKLRILAAGLPRTVWASVNARTSNDNNVMQ
jgi:hypothetical protein